MKETERIASLFEKLYQGSPWIDVNIKDTLAIITAEDAASHPIEKCNSIWQIVNHLISWRLNVLKRIQGEVITTPNHNYFLEITDTSEAAWKKTLQHLDESQQKWMAFLKTFNTEDFSKIYPNNNMDYYEHIHGILQHDCYHLGQILLLAKCLS